MNLLLENKNNKVVINNADKTLDEYKIQSEICEKLNLAKTNQVNLANQEINVLNNKLDNNNIFIQDIKKVNEELIQNFSEQNKTIRKQKFQIKALKRIIIVVPVITLGAITYKWLK